MHPDLIPGFPLKTYGVCMAVGFLIGWQALAYLCRRAGRDMEKLSNLVVWLMVSGIAGSRLAYVIEHWSAEFARQPLSVFFVWQGGLMFYGGFLLAFAVLIGWCRVKRERLMPIADLLACVIPLAHACGRIGCFFYGCCYGKRSDAWWAVSFPGGSPASHEQFREGALSSPLVPSLPVLPTQFVEAGANLVLFGAMMWLFRGLAKAGLLDRRSGLLAGAYLCGYALLRFGVETLRGDPRAAVAVFSISQAIALGLFSVGLVCCAVAFLRGKR